MCSYKTKVFIDGAAGTTGLRIRERMSDRADVELLTLNEADRKNPAKKKEALNRADAVFLCLPDDAARESVSLVDNPKTKIIDASTAHRTCADWAYGFPELSAAHRERVRSSGRVAVPGCHAGGFCAVVYPLVSGGIIGPDYPVSAFSLTGYSGGGKGMIAAYGDPAREAVYESPAVYGLSQSHKHLPEMKTVCGLSESPAFSPIVADFYSGMTVGVHINPRLCKKRLSLEALREFYSLHYAAQALVTVAREEDPDIIRGSIYSGVTAGRDSMKIFVLGCDERLSVFAVFDNLGKGASGAAVQCFNIMTGREETLGLLL